MSSVCRVGKGGDTGYNADMKSPAAVVLFSGGLDSTTALYWALERFGSAAALTFSYEQTHGVEVEAARRVAAHVGVEWRLLNLPLGGWVKSALVGDGKEIPESLADSRKTSSVPPTYVPFRNGIFLSLAAAWAESRQIFHLVTGFNRIDTPDYPDTTMEFAARMEAAINAGTAVRQMRRRFQIHLPLVKLSKKMIVQLGLYLGADYSRSISCYRGGEVPCRRCASCESRFQAFAQLGLEDPLVTRLKKEGRYELGIGG